MIEPRPGKRNSGRTSQRRLTAAEVAQRDQHAAADHRRRYGQPMPANETPMPAPPSWFSVEQREIWKQTLMTAPPGLLRAVDADNLMVLCTAVALYRRLARQFTEQNDTPATELVQQLRLVGNEVGRASRLLGLNPPERARIGLAAPIPAEQQAAERWGPLDAVKAAA